MAAIVVYAPADPVVADRVIFYHHSANTPAYDGEPNKLVNPDLSAVSGLARRYWKRSGSSVVAMTAQEQTDLDDSMAVAPEHAAISAYDSAGGQTFTTVATTINLDATHALDLGYTLVADEITVADAGTYEIAWAVSLIVTSSSRTHGESWVENTGSEIAGTRSEHYCRQTNHGGTGGGKITLDLAAGDVIRLRAVRTAGSGSCQTTLNGSRLTLTRKN